MVVKEKFQAAAIMTQRFRSILLVPGRRGLEVRKADQGQVF